MSQNKTLQQAHLLKRMHMLFQMMSLFSAVGRNGKGYTIVGVRSLVVDEVNRQISLF